MVDIGLLHHVSSHKVVVHATIRPIDDTFTKGDFYDYQRQYRSSIPHGYTPPCIALRLRSYSVFMGVGN